MSHGNNPSKKIDVFSTKKYGIKWNIFSVDVFSSKKCCKALKHFQRWCFQCWKNTEKHDVKWNIFSTENINFFTRAALKVRWSIWCRTYTKWHLVNSINTQCHSEIDIWLCDDSDIWKLKTFWTCAIKTFRGQFVSWLSKSRCLFNYRGKCLFSLQTFIEINFMEKA